MFITNILNSDVLEYQPALQQYYGKFQTDFTNIIVRAKDILAFRLKSNGRELKKLSTPLLLHNLGLESASIIGLETTKDYVECSLLYLNIFAISGTATFTLKGKIKSSDNFTTILTLSKTTTGITKLSLTELYYYYRLDFSISTSGSCNYQAELRETIFDIPHIFLSLSMIYATLTNKLGDNWEESRNYYYTMFEKAENVVLMSYDENKDNIIEDTEANQLKIVTFRR